MQTKAMCEQNLETILSSLARAHLNGLRQNGKVFCSHMNQNLKFFLETTDVLSCRPERRGTIRTALMPMVRAAHTSGRALSMLKSIQRLERSNKWSNPESVSFIFQQASAEPHAASITQQDSTAHESGC